MINCQDIKIGTCINLEGQLYFCIDFLHVKPGKGNTLFVQNSRMSLTAAFWNVLSRLVSNLTMSV